MLHVVAPYPSSNATVRARALAWIDRCAAADGVSPEQLAVVHGPGFAAGRPPAGTPVLLLRNARKFSRGRTEAKLLERAAPGVYDIDDGLPWDNGALPGLGHWWKRPWPRSLIARRSASAAARVIAGNDVLAQWAGQFCTDVVVIPTCVEPGDYQPKLRYDVGDRPVIGWLGSPATEHYLVGIADALREVNRRTGAVVQIVSAPGEVPPALQSFTTRVPWSLAVASAAPANWDVGVMPLADGVYERAKCGYKLLQYAAAGLPMVGSPVGVNARLLSDADGLAPTATDEWVDALSALLTEPSERRQARGEAGRQVAERHSYAVWEPAWRTAVGIPHGGAPR